MLKPINDRVIVRRAEVSNRTASGIIIPEVAQKKPTAAVVLSVGPEVTQVKEGDRVCLAEYSGIPVTVEGVEHVIIREDDILFVEE